MPHGIASRTQALVQRFYFLVLGRSAILRTGSIDCAQQMNLVKYWLRRLMEDPEEREKKLERYVMEAAEGVTSTIALSKPSRRADEVSEPQPLLRKTRNAHEIDVREEPMTLQRVMALLRVYDEKASAR